MKSKSYKKGINIRRLSKQYENISSQLERGRQVGYYWQGTRLIPKFVSWQPHEYAIRKDKMDGVMNLIVQARVLYASETIREPAIATVNEEGVFRYVPLSKTGLKPYQVTEIRRG